jgi:putative transposase
MPQSLAKVLIHIVFSTKSRKPFLDDDGLRSELYSYMSSLLKNKVDSPAVIINGMPDHLHVLCLLSRKFSIVDVITEIKAESAKWLKKQSDRTKLFAWQSGYGVFSVSESNCNQMQRYIREQLSHHQKLSFQDELRLLYKKHGIDFDERYAWD